MFLLHATLGALLIIINLLIGFYLSYKLKTSKKRENSKPIILLLSESLIAVAIGVLNIFCNDCDEELELFGVRNSTCDNSCEYDMLMKQEVLLITIIHCLMSLITSGEICKKCFHQSEASAKNGQLLTVMILQWLFPIIVGFSMFYTIQPEHITKSCESNSTTSIIHNFQTLVSELLEKPVNTTEKSVYETEIDQIIGKVYSIVETATEINKKNANLDEGFQIYNILNKLNTARSPKQFSTDEILNTTPFKIFTLFFILIGYLFPIIYTNNTRIKLNLEQNKDLNRYLLLLIMSAGSLWMPSIGEIFTRTFITQTPPDLMEILMLIGSSFVIVKNGINMKLISKLVRENTIEPKA